MEKSGKSNDLIDIKIKKILTIGKLEDYLRENNINCVLLSGKNGKGKILFRSDFTIQVTEIVKKIRNFRKVNLEIYSDKEFYTYYFSFEPWDWEIVLLKKADFFNDLKNKVQIIYSIMGGLLILLGTILAFLLNIFIKRPIDKIIYPIMTHQYPDYEKNESILPLLNQTIESLNEISKNNKKNKGISLIIKELQSFSNVIDEDGNVKRYYISKIIGEFNNNDLIKKEEILVSQKPSLWLEIISKKLFLKENGAQGRSPCKKHPRPGVAGPSFL